MLEQVALSADFHFRVELMVVEPDEARRKSRITVSVRDPFGIFVPHGKADQVIHVPQYRIHPLLGHLGDGLRGEPAPDAELTQLGKKGGPVYPVREVLELVYDDGEILAVVRWPA